MSVAPSVYSFACPACARVGKSPRPIPPGAKVRCKCGHAFLAGDASTPDIPLMQPEIEHDPEGETMADAPGMDAGYAPVDLGAIADKEPEPLVQARPEPLSAATLPKVRAKEPFYFRVMEIFGWSDVVIGIAQFAIMGVISLIFVGNMLYRADEGLVWMALVASIVGMSVPMAISAGILASCLLSGYFLWITVDIARSLRHANHLRIMMGRED